MAMASADMELKDFIRQSLIEITEGVHEANTAYKDARQTDHNAFLLAPGRKDDEGRGIHFDVAVTTKTMRGSKGKATIGIKVFGVGADVEASKAKESVSRIRFTVMVRHYLG